MSTLEAVEPTIEPLVNPQPEPTTDSSSPSPDPPPEQPKWREPEVNDLVIRGPTWKWENQDRDPGGGQCLGFITRPYSNDPPYWHSIQWASGHTYDYRISQSCDDVIVIGHYDEDLGSEGSWQLILTILEQGADEFRAHFEKKYYPSKTPNQLWILYSCFIRFLTQPFYIKFLTEQMRINLRLILIALTQDTLEKKISQPDFFFLSDIIQRVAFSEDDILSLTDWESQSRLSLGLIQMMFTKKWYRCLEALVKNPIFLRLIARESSLQQLIMNDQELPKNFLFKLRDSLVFGEANQLGGLQQVNFQKIKALNRKYDPKYVREKPTPLVCSFCHDSISEKEKQLYQPAGETCSCYYHLGCAIDMGRSLFRLAQSDREYLKPNCLGCQGELELGFLYLISSYAFNQQWMYGSRILRVSYKTAEKRITIINQAFREKLANQLHLVPCSSCQRVVPMIPDQEDWLPCPYCQHPQLFQGQVKKQQDELKRSEIQKIITQDPNRFKPCQRCFKLLEKNGGCEHFTCKFCKHEFNWDEVDSDEAPQSYEKIHY